MKIKIILSLLCTAGCLLGMQQGQDGGDPVTGSLYTFFNVPRYYDAMQKYDKNITRYSTEKEIEKSYRTLSRKYHQDKGSAKEDNQTFNEIFSVFKQNNTAVAGESHILKNMSKEEYDTYLRFIDIYSAGIKAAAAGITLYSCWLAYKWAKNNFGASPKATLNKLHSSMHSTVDRLLAVKFDRYVHAKKDFSVQSRVDTRQLCAKLSAQLSEKLFSTMTHADETIANAYETIAWDYYDCQSVEEMKTRAPQVVQDLLACQEQIDTVIDECKKELGIESFYTSCKRMAKPVLGVAGFIGLGACWMRYQQSRVKVFGGHITT